MSGLMSSLKKFKFFLKKTFYYPRFRAIGFGTKLLPPFSVYNSGQIRLGERTRFGRYAVLNIFENKGRPEGFGQLTIGSDVYFGGHAEVHCFNEITIGDGCVFSEHVYVSDVAHGLDPTRGPIMKQALESKGGVEIGEHSFVGFGASVMPGVKLGKHCVVATRSVVTRSFPDYSMVAGIPARLIKRYSMEQRCWVNVD